MRQDRVYRIYKKMHMSKSWFIRKVLHFYLRVVYTCDIMPQTVIGYGTYFAHCGLGVIINQDAVIGNNVKIGAHVIIGGRNGDSVVPIIGDDVEIGVGAIILGNVTIGENAIIGAGTIILKSVPANAVVVGNSARILKYRDGKDK